MQFEEDKYKFIGMDLASGPDMTAIYTIEPWTFALMYGQAYFKAGDLIDILTGDTIAGPYCVWPKTEPKYFVMTGGRRQGKTQAQKLAQQVRDKFK